MNRTLLVSAAALVLYHSLAELCLAVTDAQLAQALSAAATRAGGVGAAVTPPPPPPPGPRPPPPLSSRFAASAVLARSAQLLLQLLVGPRVAALSVPALFVTLGVCLAVVAAAAWGVTLVQSLTQARAEGAVAAHQGEVPEGKVLA